MNQKVRRIDEYTSLLAISNLETDHAGNYSCVATNSVAEYVRSAVLTIRGEFNKSYQKILMNDQISGKYLVEKYGQLVSFLFLKFFWDQFLLFLSFYSTFLDSRSEEEKCCHDKEIPIDCFRFCTPVSSAGRFTSSKNIFGICIKYLELIIECKDISKGTF